MTANWPIPAVRAGSRRTAARVTLGAICLSSSSHFPLKPYSNCIKPVALPPGRARLSTKPAPTGSATFTNTTGTVRVACNNGPKAEVPEARMTSGASAANSAAYLRMLAASPAPQRIIDLQVAAVGPARLLQHLQQCLDARLRVWIVRGRAAVSTRCAASARWLLRARRERPRRRAAEKPRGNLCVSFD